MSRKELLKRIRAGLVTVLDTRPSEEYAAGHLPGAINIAPRALKRRLRELPREQEIIAYCRGQYCVLSYEAVAELRRRGFKAVRLEDGFPEWKAARLPIETSAAISLTATGVPPRSRAGPYEVCSHGGNIEGEMPTMPLG